MVFDLDMIKKVYAEFPGKIAKAREVLGRPLTLSHQFLSIKNCVELRNHPDKILLISVYHPTQ